MWLATRHGFYSIACAHAGPGQPHPNLVVVRARKHAHLAAARRLVPLPPIRHNHGTDYPYRIICTRAEAAALVQALQRDIDYTNFKEAAGAAMPGDRAYISFLHHVWRLGLGLTPTRVSRKLGQWLGVG